MGAVSEKKAPRPSALAGYALVAAAATSWGAQSIVAKVLLTSGLPPSWLISTRTALASVIVAGTLAAVKPGLLRVSARDLCELGLLGIVMALSQYTYYFALTRIPVATTLLVIYTSPLLVLAASVLIHGEPLERRDLIAAAATLVGAAFVVRAYEPEVLRLNALGLTASVFCAAAFAFYSLWGKRAAPAASPWTRVTYSLGTAAVFWLPLAPPWTLLQSAHPPAIWLGLAVVVVFGTLLPFGLFLSGLARISAAHASLTATLEPIVAAVVAYFVLGERLEPLQLVGGGLVLGGIALLHIR